jgi:thioredoxin reductase (NADPH)
MSPVARPRRRPLLACAASLLAITLGGCSTLGTIAYLIQPNDVPAEFDGLRGKHVAVVGGGDTAMEEANYLTRHADKVTLIHRRDSFRASKIMQERVLANPKIEVLWNTAVDEVLGDLEPRKKVTGLALSNTVTGEKSQIALDGLFVAIGHKPNSDLFVDVLAHDETGYLKVEPGSTRTAIPGVFACGDVTDPIYRQAVTAAGTGCMAAIDAERWLESQESH